MKTMMVIAAAAALATVGVIEGVPRAEAAPVTGACAMHQASIYFERDGVQLNAFSKQIIARLAADARACGRVRVVAEAPGGPLHVQRVKAVAAAFASVGVTAVMGTAQSAAENPAGEESMGARSVAVRMEPAPTVLAQLN